MSLAKFIYEIFIVPMHLSVTHLTFIFTCTLFSKCRTTLQPAYHHLLLPTPPLLALITTSSMSIPITTITGLRSPKPT